MTTTINHPLLQRLQFIQFVALVLVGGLIQAGVDIRFFSFPTTFALIDATVYHSTYFLFALSLWYYIGHTWCLRLSLWRTFVIHKFALLSVIGIWGVVSYGILSFLFANNPEYLAYLDLTFVIHLMAGLPMFILVGLIYFLFLLGADRRESRQNEVRLRENLREAEIELLKSQINPHFLFNSLNSVSMLTLTDSEKAHQMIVALSEYLRYSISGRHESMASLRAELENVGRYLEIEKIRFGNRLVLEFQVAPTALEEKVPIMILQPLFENAIKHGVYESSEQVAIHANITLENGTLEINVRNNFEPNSGTKKGAGMGLKNVRDRLRMAYGPGRALLSTEKGESIFTAQIRIERSSP